MEFLVFLAQLSAGGGEVQEPNVGSAASMGLETTCKREGDSWILNGQKKWIGNASLQEIFDQALDALIQESRKEKPDTPLQVFSNRSRFISIHAKRIISRRSGDQCEYFDPKTKIRCTSRDLNT